MSVNKLVYSEIETSINTIDQLTDQITKALNTMNELIADNVNNPKVWEGQSASNFMSRWQPFAEEFPEFIRTFKKQSAKVRTVLQNTQTEDV